MASTVSLSLYFLSLYVLYVCIADDVQTGMQSETNKLVYEERFCKSEMLQLMSVHTLFKLNTFYVIDYDVDQSNFEDFTLSQLQYIFGLG